MRTGELIAALADGVRPVKPGAPRRRCGWAATAGTLLAVLLAGGALHFNPGLPDECALGTFWIREGFCAALAAVGLWCAIRLSRPAGRIDPAPWAAGLTVVALWAVAIAALAAATPASRAGLFWGHTARVCSVLIAALATPVFVGLIWAVRGLAPTRLRAAGAACGLAAGGLGALAYSLHCPELAPPFIATWYLLGMLIPTLVGAALGPRLLRW